MADTTTGAASPAAAPVAAPTAPAADTSASSPTGGSPSQAASPSQPSSTPTESPSGASAEAGQGTTDANASPPAQPASTPDLSSPPGARNEQASEAGTAEGTPEGEPAEGTVTAEGSQEGPAAPSLPEDFDLREYVLREFVPEEYRDPEGKYLFRDPQEGGSVYEDLKQVFAGLPVNQAYMNDLKTQLEAREQALQEREQRIEALQGANSEHDTLLTALLGQLGVEGTEAVQALAQTVLPEEYRGKSESDFETPEELRAFSKALGRAEVEAERQIAELKSQQEAEAKAKAAEEEAKAKRVERGAELFQEHVTAGSLGGRSAQEQHAEGTYLDTPVGESGVVPREVLQRAYEGGEEVGNYFRDLMALDFQTKIGRSIPIPSPEEVAASDPQQGANGVTDDQAAQGATAPEVEVTDQTIDSKPHGSSSVAAERGITGKDLASMSTQEVMKLAIQQRQQKRRAMA